VPRGTFERELKELQDSTKDLAAMVDIAIERSVRALKERDLDLAHNVIDDDKKINSKRYAIEQEAMLVLATQQPMASDLRTIAAVMSIITDLERMGDHAEGIAKIALMIGKEPPLKPLIDIPRMAEISRNMLERAMQAFAERNSDLAMEVIKQDDEVDNLYNQVYRELLSYMIQDTSTIDRATHLLWVAHNLERIGDRATNICERVVYLVTGHMGDLAGSSPDLNSVSDTM
jgi:phosphate transport system protein